MAAFVLVTFDLHGASPEKYKTVKLRLAKLKLHKHVRAATDNETRKLPANTYVAKYKDTWNERRAAELRDALRKRVRKILVEENLKATVFIVVAKNWAWGKAYV
jgi:hypothetical protein